MKNKKNYLFVIFVLLYSACFSNQQNLKDLLIGNDNLKSEDGVTYGFLKKHVLIDTPYGKMTATAIGSKRKYPFDFSFYKKTNVPSKFWPRTEEVIKIDGITITIAMTMTVYLTSEEDAPEYLLKRVPIEFYDNYNLKSCYLRDAVKYLDFIIPIGSCLFFNKKEKLDSFVIYREWTFKGDEYKDGSKFIIREGVISPLIN